MLWEELKCGEASIPGGDWQDMMTWTILEIVDACPPEEKENGWVGIVEVLVLVCPLSVEFNSHHLPYILLHCYNYSTNIVIRLTPTVHQSSPRDERERESKRVGERESV